VAIELTRLRVPMVSAHHSAVTSAELRDSVLVRVTAADGVEGLGECPTLAQAGYVTETTDAAWSALTGGLAASALAGSTSAVHAAPAASAALADALLDCDLRRRGVSLAAHLSDTVGCAARPSVNWTAVLASAGGDLDSLRAAAEQAVADGATMLKAKVDGREHLESTAAVLEHAGAAGVALDANGSLRDVDWAVVDELGLEYLEQPLPAGTPWPELAAAEAGCRTPLALDESLVSLDALADAIRARALSVANIKPARIGGVLAAGRAAAMCRGAGLACFVGGMFELGPGRATALAVAGLECCTLPTDLGPSRRYFTHDVAEPLETDTTGAVCVPNGIGCGRTLLEDRVEQYLVDRVVIGRAG
jgi:O-succinylbenzoate synthase